MGCTHGIERLDLSFTAIDQLVGARRVALWGGRGLGNGLVGDCIVRDMQRVVRRQNLAASYIVGLLTIGQMCSVYKPRQTL